MQTRDQTLRPPEPGQRASGATEPAAAYFRALRSRWDAAASAGGTLEHHVQIGAHTVRLRFAGDALAGGVLPALTGSSPAAASSPVATIHLFDTSSTGVHAPPVPWRREHTRARGDVVDFGEPRFRTVCLSDEPADGGRPRSVSIWDQAARCGVFWVRGADQLTWWERAAPLRFLLPWALAAPSRCVVHAAAIGSSERGLLLAGRSGSGKTTTTLACLEHGLLTAGDDFVLLEAGPAPVAHAIYATTKVEAAGLALVPRLAPRPAGEAPIDAGAAATDSARKHVFAIDAVWPGALTPAIQVDALVVPHITGGASRIVPTPAAGALSALASPTLLQLPVGGDSLAVMARIARTVPCFALELGPAADGAAAIADLLAGMAT